MKRIVLKLPDPALRQRWLARRACFLGEQRGDACMHFPGPFTKDPGSWCEVSGPVGLIRRLPLYRFYGSSGKGSPPQQCL